MYAAISKNKFVRHAKFKDVLFVDRPSGHRQCKNPVGFVISKLNTDKVFARLIAFNNTVQGVLLLFTYPTTSTNRSR